MSDIDLSTLGVEFVGGFDEGDQITEAVVIAKVAKFATGETSLAIGLTPGMDWIAQRGLMSAAQFVLDSEPAEEC